MYRIIKYCNFRCYVAEDQATRLLVGYVLYFNTLDERAVGANGACSTDDPVAVVEDLYVAPDYRGRGIATQLFRKVLQVSSQFAALPLPLFTLISCCKWHFQWATWPDPCQVNKTD